MNEREALEYAAKILEAEVLMGYGADADRFAKPIRILKRAAENQEYRATLEDAGDFRLGAEPPDAKEQKGEDV